jgi:hypothetical protein
MSKFDEAIDHLDWFAENWSVSDEEEKEFRSAISILKTARFLDEIIIGGFDGLPKDQWFEVKATMFIPSKGEAVMVNEALVAPYDKEK